MHSADCRLKYPGTLFAERNENAGQAGEEMPEKKKAPEAVELLVLECAWLGDKGSNLDKRSQSPLPYH